MVNLVLNKMEETFQSNTLDWSSLVIIIIIIHFLLSLPLCLFCYNFVNSWPIHLNVSQYNDGN